jgi:hypothetical protein
MELSHTILRYHFVVVYDFAKMLLPSVSFLFVSKLLDIIGSLGFISGFSSIFTFLLLLSRNSLTISESAFEQSDGMSLMARDPSKLTMVQDFVDTHHVVGGANIITC